MQYFGCLFKIDKQSCAESEVIQTLYQSILVMRVLSLLENMDLDFYLHLWPQTSVITDMSGRMSFL